MEIYHISTLADWQQAQIAGQYTVASLAQEGFIHASSREQVVDSANRHYHGQSGLVLLVIDPAKVKPEVRFDPVTLRGEQTTFPHIYGPINLDAVRQVLQFTPSPDGTFTEDSIEKK